MPIDSTIWKKFPNLKPQILLKNSDFRRHPDVLKGNASAEQLLKEFEEKMDVFLSFGNYLDFDLNVLCRFFSFYVGSKVKDEYFWFLVHKVFQIKCTEFGSLSKYTDMHDVKEGREGKLTAEKSPQEDFQESDLRSRRSQLNSRRTPSRRGEGASHYGSRQRDQLAKLNNDNTNRLRNQEKFIQAVEILRKNIFSDGMGLLLGLKNQFQIYEKDAAILESRGAFMKTPNYQQMKQSGTPVFRLGI